MQRSETHRLDKRSHWKRGRRQPSSCRVMVWSRCRWRRTTGSPSIPGRTRQSRGCRLTHRDCWIRFRPAVAPFPLLSRGENEENEIIVRRIPKNIPAVNRLDGGEKGTTWFLTARQLIFQVRRGGSLCVTGLQISAKRIN